MWLCVSLADDSGAQIAALNILRVTWVCSGPVGRVGMSTSLEGGSKLALTRPVPSFNWLYDPSDTWGGLQLTPDPHTHPVHTLHAHWTQREFPHIKKGPSSYAVMSPLDPQLFTPTKQHLHSCHPLLCSQANRCPCGGQHCRTHEKLNKASLCPCHHTSTHTYSDTYSTSMVVDMGGSRTFRMRHKMNPKGINLQNVCCQCS